jgi:hypothetical protein
MAGVPLALLDMAGGRVAINILTSGFVTRATLAAGKKLKFL